MKADEVNYDRPLTEEERVFSDNYFDLMKRAWNNWGNNV